jgi:hypothetical protein
LQVAAAADALLVYIPHPATPHMDLGAAWTPGDLQVKETAFSVLNFKRLH